MGRSVAQFSTEVAIGVSRAGGAGTRVVAIHIEGWQQLTVDVLQGLLLHIGLHLVNGDLGALLFGFGDQVVDGFGSIGVGCALEIEGNDRHFIDQGIVDLGEGILHQQLVQTKSGARNSEVALAGGHGRLVRHDLHGGNGVELELLLVIWRGLAARRQGSAL